MKGGFTLKIRLHLNKQLPNLRMIGNCKFYKCKGKSFLNFP